MVTFDITSLTRLGLIFLMAYQHINILRVRRVAKKSKLAFTTSPRKGQLVEDLVLQVDLSFLEL
jgi:hypothetical protein